MSPEELEEFIFRDRGVALKKAEKEAIYIPGISDLVHIVPKTKISDTEMKAHKAAAKAGRVSPLSKAQLELLAENKKRAIRISESPTPAVVRQVGQVLTWFDDMGDAMTTAAWGAKGLVWVATKIGIKAATRAIPYVGWALAAKDVFDMVSLFSLKKKVTAVGRVEKAYNSAVRTAGGRVTGKTAKMGRWYDTEINPFGKKAQISRAGKIARQIPTFGNIVEIAQTTDQLFGVGISFGPAVGFVEDLIFGVPSGAPIKVGWSPKNGEVETALAGYVGGCLSQLVAAPFTLGERLLPLAAVGSYYDNHRAELMSRWELANGTDLWNVPMGLKPIKNEAIRFTLEEIGVDPDGPARWPIAGEPEYISMAELSPLLASSGRDRLAEWLPAFHRQEESMVAGELINGFTMGFLQDAAGSGAEWSYGLSAVDRVTQDLLEGNLKLPEDLGDDESIEWIAGQIKKREAENE